MVRGPTTAGFHAGNPVAITTSAQNIDLNGVWGGASGRLVRGAAYLRLEARGGDVYYRLAPVGNVAGTTAGAGSNGSRITDGQFTEIEVTAATPIVDAIGSAVCTGFVFFSSPNYANNF
jgi:hypothetical protein